MNSQAQGLFLEGNEGPRAPLAARNFPLGPPVRRHGASAKGPATGGRGSPGAVSCGPREGLVARDSGRSLAHSPTRVASGPPGALRSGALCPVNTRRKAGGLAVMLHFCALRHKPSQEGCMWALAVGNWMSIDVDNCNHTQKCVCFLSSCSATLFLHGTPKKQHEVLHKCDQIVFRTNKSDLPSVRL